jgi:thioredoxin reductase
VQDQNTFDSIIIGGSYSGLSAAMALGRASRKVLVIDSGMPCNRQTPHSHNFLTQDGKTPAEISGLARTQVEQYNTIQFVNGKAVQGAKTDMGFEIATNSGEKFNSRTLLFSSGVKDNMLTLPGFSDCWGISVVHCPYCHGYEIKNVKTGILANGDMAIEMAKLISNWSKDLTLFTNGPSALTAEQTAQLQKNQIRIVEKELNRIEHSDGYLNKIVFKDDSSADLEALYAKPSFEQHCPIAQELGCELNEGGHIKVDGIQQTNIPGIYASGDCTSPMRTVAHSVSSGTMAGIAISKQVIFEEF